MSNETVDVVLVGAGIMSTTLGVFLKELKPDLKIEMIEREASEAQESSGAWNNTSTGHAANCELNYTPMRKDGSVDIAKALAGNELRLVLEDAGAGQPAANFAGALSVGLLASVVQHRLGERRIEITVPGIIIMVPGSAALQSFVLFSRGDTLGGLQAAVLAVFVVGAMALGLSAARFVSERKWLYET